jgi:hypothetical protein
MESAVKDLTINSPFQRYNKNVRLASCLYSFITLEFENINMHYSMWIAGNHRRRETQYFQRP